MRSSAADQRHHEADSTGIRETHSILSRLTRICYHVAARRDDAAVQNRHERPNMNDAEQAHRLPRRSRSLLMELGPNFRSQVRLVECSTSVSEWKRSTRSRSWLRRR